MAVRRLFKVFLKGLSQLTIFTVVVLLKLRSCQADKLVALAGDVELFHTPGGHDSEAFATFNVDGHRET